MGATKNICVNSKFQTFQKIALILILFVIVLSLPSLCYSHESPSFKYSREANENFDPKSIKPVHHHDNIHEEHHDHFHGHDTHHDHGHDDNGDHLHGNLEHGRNNPHRPSKGKTAGESNPKDLINIWIQAIGSTLLISAAPFLLLYVIPLDSSESMKPRLKVLLAFASGGLLGDAFLHLIPHAAHPHSHNEGSRHKTHNHHDGHEHEIENQHKHSHDMAIGLWVLGGIITFLSVEKLVRLLKDNSHGHSKPFTAKSVKTDDNKESQKHKGLKKNAKQNEKVQISGYLNLAADFAHNFTDGLAIGASYLAGNSIGIITTITILFHEVPHEIGDFAILIKSGCSRTKAIRLQLVTALGAVAGTCLALLGADSNDKSSWVLPFTAGGFIYIATVSVLPELLEESTKLMQSLKEIIALLAGVFLMVVIANFE